MNFIDYREKLGIAYCDSDKFNYFFTIIFNTLDLLSESEECSIEFNEYYEFCSGSGSELDSSLVDDDCGTERFEDCVTILKRHRTDIKEFLLYYVWFANSIKLNTNCCWRRIDFINFLKECLNQSRIPYEVLNCEQKSFIFPKGAKELDDALVSQVLEWLSDYPNSRNALTKALKDYTNQTGENTSEIADKFRKALETFFQEFFNSNSSLENLKSEYGKYLKEKGVPTEISCNFETMLQSYTNYINNYAKHHDKTSNNVLEYIMYQTGNIIRLLITLSND